MVGEDGLPRPAVHYLVQEALSAGAQQVCIVTSPGGDVPFRRYFREAPAQELRALEDRSPALRREAELLGQMAACISYCVQPTQDGLGHAIWCTREFASGEPVIVLLGDHLFLSARTQTCAAQVVQWQQHTGGNISAAYRVGDEDLHRRGVILPEGGGPPWRIAGLVEKPAPGAARQALRLPDGADPPYLVFFGIHILQPDIFDCLEALVRENKRERGEIQLTSAQMLQARSAPCFAVPIDGQTWDIGQPAGYAAAQAALAARRTQ